MPSCLLTCWLMVASEVTPGVGERALVDMGLGGGAGLGLGSGEGRGHRIAC